MFPRPIFRRATPAAASPRHLAGRLAAALAGIFSLAAAVASQPAPAARGATVGAPLPLWSEGCLDIHHINTGKGETSFFTLPDGTTMLVDGGAALSEGPWGAAPKPNGTRPPGEWAARYILHMLQKFPEKKLDYVLLSHFHWDHMGGIATATKRSRSGAYHLGGVTEVAEHIPFGKVVDRNWPDYNWPVPLTDLKMKNYRQFLAWQASQRGVRVEQFKVGVNDQFALLRNGGKYSNFEIRNLAANGRVWTGVGANERAHFPPLESLAKDNYPGENTCSIAIRLSYGKFDYFTGGDLDVRDVETAGVADQWKDIERPIALVTGPVEAMKANHHANYDANSPFFLSMLRPQVIVVQTWGASQPAMSVYRRMLSSSTYPGARDLFITNLMASTVQSLHIDKTKTKQGHFVIRVSPGGENFFVFVLDDTTEEFRVKAVHGPYACR